MFVMLVVIVVNFEFEVSGGCGYLCDVGFGFE